MSSLTYKTLSLLCMCVCESYAIDEALGYTIWQYEIITLQTVLISEAAHKDFS